MPDYDVTLNTPRRPMRPLPPADEMPETVDELQVYLKRQIRGA
mgnify:CR=1 FL=1